MFGVALSTVTLWCRCPSALGRRRLLRRTPRVNLDVGQWLVESLATGPYRHEVSVVVDGNLDDLRRDLSASIATLEPLATGVRVRIRAERLDWAAAVLVGLGRTFRVEQPGELRDLVRDVAQRLREAVG